MSSSQSRPAMTMDAGVPVASQRHSQTIAPDGPILLKDFYLIDTVSNILWTTSSSLAR